MKQIKNIVERTIAYSGLLLVLMLMGCTNFLDRPQQNNFDDQTFWTSEDKLLLYANEFYAQFFVGYNSGYGTDYAPFNGYTFSDDVVSKGNQTSFEQIVPSDRPTSGGNNNTMNSSGQVSAPAWQSEYAGPTWYFGWIRKANLMINRIESRMGGILTQEQYNHWIAVGRFFKGLEYSRLVSVFGNVPYFEKYLETSDLTMYKDRQPRGEVMDAVYEDFKFVMENIRSDDGVNVLNKDIAAAFISRWMLFEGTWEYYHKDGDKARAEKYLKMAVDAAASLMGGKYAIDKPMRELFGSESLVGDKESIMYRIYTTALVMHCVTSYNNGAEGQSVSVNLDFVKDFLCNDGEVWQKSSVADAAKFNRANLVKTRDPRFEAYFHEKLNIFAPGLLYVTKFVDRIAPSMEPSKLTANYISNTNTCDAPVIRYGEVLLNWIEAKAVLGKLGGAAVTQDDIDKSINVIRKRPLDKVALDKDMKQLPPLSLAALPDDPDRDSDVDPLMWEIRRERRIELFMEPSRLLDIKRWGKLDKMQGATNPDILKSIWVDLPEELPVTVNPNYKGITHVMKEDGRIVVFDGTNAAEMVGWYLPDNIVDRQPFTDRSYLSPIGKNEINLYEKKGYTLSQTTGW